MAIKISEHTGERVNICVDVGAIACWFFWTTVLREQGTRERQTSKILILHSLIIHPPLIRSHPHGGSSSDLLWGHVWESNSDRSDELARLLVSKYTVLLSSSH